MASWLVAALVIVINGYLLLECFSSEVNGLFFGCAVSAFTAVYVGFITYFISGDITISNALGLLHTKKSTKTVN